MNFIKKNGEMLHLGMLAGLLTGIVNYYIASRFSLTMSSFTPFSMYAVFLGFIYLFILSSVTILTINKFAYFNLIRGRKNKGKDEQIFLIGVSSFCMLLVTDSFISALEYFLTDPVIKVSYQEVAVFLPIAIQNILVYLLFLVFSVYTAFVLTRKFF